MSSIVPISRRAALLSSVALPLGLMAGEAAPASAQASTPESAPQSTTSTQLTLPAPTGPHRLGTTSLYLIDPARRDPWVPAIPYRALVIQLWYPASTVAGHPLAPWMSPATARSLERDNALPTLNWPITNGHLGAPVERHPDGRPVVIYSPGFEDDRETNTVHFEELASHGYVVATIDHVHDASEVELPDGQLVTTAIPPITPDNEQALSIEEVESKVADVRFVLDQLAAINRGDNPDQAHRPLPQGLRGALDLDRIGMFGHSTGGSTTAHALHVEPRIKAGVNLDGTLWTAQALAGSDRPLLQFGVQDLVPVEASSWAQLKPNQRGPLLQLSLTGSMHRTFTDLAALIPQIAPIAPFPEDFVIQLVGTINGERAVAIERAYIRAFFDAYLRHLHSPLLTGPSPRYPEVVFIP